MFFEYVSWVLWVFDYRILEMRIFWPFELFFGWCQKEVSAFIAAEVLYCKNSHNTPSLIFV